MDLTISITSYNTKYVLSETLQAIIENTHNVEYEIVVVDNNSSDGTIEYIEKAYPEIILIKNDENRYLCYAQNQALKIARGKYFLICNSDMYIPENTIEEMVRFLNNHPDAGSVGCVNFGDKGNPQNLAYVPWDVRTFSQIVTQNSYVLSRFVKPKNTAYRELDSSLATQTVPINGDAFMMCITDLLRKIGGYDEKFKLFYTEDDLSLRILTNGYRNYFLNYAHVYNTGGGSQSTRQLPRFFLQKIHIGDALAYTNKYFGDFRYCMARIILYFDLYFIYRLVLFFKK